MPFTRGRINGAAKKLFFAKNKEMVVALNHILTLVSGRGKFNYGPDNRPQLVRAKSQKLRIKPLAKLTTIPSTLVGTLLVHRAFILICSCHLPGERSFTGTICQIIMVKTDDTIFNIKSVFHVVGLYSAQRNITPCISIQTNRIQFLPGKMVQVRHQIRRSVLRALRNCKVGRSTTDQQAIFIQINAEIDMLMGNQFVFGNVKIHMKSFFHSANAAECSQCSRTEHR